MFVQTTNNHDLLGFRLYTDPQEAWEVDTYRDEDEDELDSLVHHMEHELFSEFLLSHCTYPFVECVLEIRYFVVRR